MKKNEREPVEQVRVLSLEIYLKTGDVNPLENQFESKFTYRCSKQDAILILESYIAHLKKGEKTDGRA